MPHKAFRPNCILKFSCGSGICSVSRYVGFHLHHFLMVSISINVCVAIGDGSSYSTSGGLQDILEPRFHYLRVVSLMVRDVEAPPDVAPALITAIGHFFVIYKHCPARHGRRPSPQMRWHGDWRRQQPQHERPLPGRPRAAVPWLAAGLFPRDSVMGTMPLSVPPI